MGFDKKYFIAAKEMETERSSLDAFCSMTQYCHAARYLPYSYSKYMEGLE